ncbi:MAG: DUF1801 domain-containing protein, partial [Planctomycetota bacterium]
VSRPRPAAKVAFQIPLLFSSPMQSQATTVAAYLKQLPAERRAVIEAVRKVILANLDRGIEETMNYGMIGYVIPHSVYPAGYHCDPSKPFPYAGLASQKNYCSLYLMPVYNEAENWFRQEWQRGGKKLNMGKCCIRFNKLEDLDLEVIANALKRFTIALSLRNYEALLGKRVSKKPAGKPTAKAAKPKAAGPTIKLKTTQPKAGGSGSKSVKSNSARSVGSGKTSGSKPARGSKAKSPAAAKSAPKSAQKKSSPKSRRK